MDEGQTPSVHLHIGGLILLIIITLILFKVNIKGAVDSPQFQDNISYIQKESTSIWNTYILKPLESIWKIISSEVPKSISNMTQPSDGSKQKSTTSSQNNVFQLPILNLDPNLSKNNTETFQLSKPVSN